MIQSLIVADDVSRQAGAIRRLALKQQFQDVDFKGHNYPGILQDEDLESLNREHICPLIARMIGFSILPRITFFRLGLKDHKPDIYIHADNAVGTEFAAVFYLSEPKDCVGGTAFWKHKELGYDMLPSPDQIERDGHKWDQAFCDRMNRDGADESLWQQADFVEMRFNRMAIYPGSRFHSRYPKDYASDDKGSGRLVWVAFFDRAET